MWTPERQYIKEEVFGATKFMHISLVIISRSFTKQIIFTVTLFFNCSTFLFFFVNPLPCTFWQYVMYRSLTDASGKLASFIMARAFTINILLATSGMAFLFGLSRGAVVCIMPFSWQNDYDILGMLEGLHSSVSGGTHELIEICHQWLIRSEELHQMLGHSWGLLDLHVQL